MRLQKFIPQRDPKSHLKIGINLWNKEIQTYQTKGRDPCDYISLECKGGNVFSCI